jgi:uncharacterized protein YndB with AHSA1/START domain
MPSNRDIVSVERVINAPPEVIFNLLADPARHPEIDGSGSVLKVRPGSTPRLTKDATFGMDMRRGMRYAMQNTVTEFDEGRRIAWAPRMTGGVGSRFGGRVWRYELEPSGDGTLVRETWDITQENLRFVLRLVAAKQTRQDMTKSLEQLDQLVTAGSAAAGS